MGKLAVAAAQAVMRYSHLIGFGGLGAGFGATPDQIRAEDPTVRFRQALFEKDGIGEFYRCFPDLDEVIADKDVLDFGCGYGGKAVEFAKVARSVAGVEPFANLIEFAERYADHTGSAATFRRCTQDSIPYPDNSFDVVLSHDVIEHVADPEVSLREIARVLRPGGVALIAFPPYDGLLSHHLDYTSTLPGLHWLFSPDTLVEAANREIARKGLPVDVQPVPKLSWDRSRKVLPNLNGLTTAQADALFSDLFANRTKEAKTLGAGRWPWLQVVGDLTRIEALRSGLRYRAHKSGFPQSAADRRLELAERTFDHAN